MKIQTQTLLVAALMAAVSLPALANHDGKGHEGHPGMHQMPNGEWMDDAAMKKPAASSTKALPAGPKVVAKVNGLVCDYCAQTIRKTLLKQPGVADATVDLSAKTVTVALKEGGSLPEATLKTVLKDAGYDMTSYKAE